ncbi:MAG: hypothetical protein IJ189_09475 [Clostridia bacterium]|nr:hypothetical protein [Clostridia bacterium]
MNGMKYIVENDDRISVPNLSAYWIPEQTIERVIHGTTYVVSGTYEGSELFTRKLERIMAKSFTTEPQENMEESEE